MGVRTNACWNDATVTDNAKLLSLRISCMLAADLNRDNDINKYM